MEEGVSLFFSTTVFITKDLLEGNMGEKCDHCPTTFRVREFKLGENKLNICRSCAGELIFMQSSMQMWVGE